MRQLVAKEKETITPCIHEVHMYDIVYDERICKYSRGEDAHHTLSSQGTHT